MPLSHLKKVLHLEDEFIISMDVDATLRAANVAEVVHFSTCREALRALDQGSFDAAILDAHVIDGSTAPVAAELRVLGIPFVLYTGSPERVEDEHGDTVKLLKPVRGEELINAMKAALSQRTAA